MMECRCEQCNSLLATDLIGEVKIKCHKQHCRKINIFTAVKQTGADQQTFIDQHEKTLSDNSVPYKLK